MGTESIDIVPKFIQSLNMGPVIFSFTGFLSVSQLHADWSATAVVKHSNGVMTSCLDYSQLLSVKKFVN
jgi:hypothetical protein